MTQKYIPVEWTDETPTQPGTLINKARLDQMQSAHHFADGFEEVDAIPTEDPGTDYHKVVYCTADSTFYRWDGAQWTADIDDDTKRLLEEHEADHSNPHQVTKAQVGLGNADNTSDADKPISTATAAALATKADKATTLAGYGIGDAYTKAQVDGKLTDGSVTKLGTATVGSDTLPIKLVGGSPTPVADALAKNSTVVHNTYNENVDGIKTFIKEIRKRGPAVGSGNISYDIMRGYDENYSRLWEICSSSRADNSTRIYVNTLKTDGTFESIVLSDGGMNPSNKVATIGTLDAYTPMVRTTGNQTIAGTKTWTGKQIISYNTLELYNSALAAQSQGYDLNNPPAYATRTLLQFYTGSDLDQVASRDECSLATAGNSRNMIVHSRSSGGVDQTATLQLTSFRDGTACVRGPSRAYNTNNGTDIVNISLLKASTDVVHTSGPETIAGTKTFYALSFSTIRIKSNRASGNIGGMDFVNKDDTTTAQIYGHTSGFIMLSIGTAAADAAIMALNQRAYDPANTTDVATIGTLDAYTPMVRTTGDQLIAGIKQGNFYTFTGAITTSSSPEGEYTSIVSLGAVGSSIQIGFTSVSRYDVCFGGIYIDSEGVATFNGTHSNSGDRYISLGVGKVGNNLHLLARRTSTAGQNVSITIHGIAKTNQRIDPPAGGVGTVNATDYVEVTKI